MTNVADMTQNELERIIFAGADVNEMRSPGDVFTVEELLSISDAPQFCMFSASFRFWIYNAIDCKLETPQ